MTPARRIENKYFAEFKPIRNRFRKYCYNELIFVAFEYLRIPTDSNEDYVQRRPWLVLLLVKWLLLDKEFPNSGGKNPTLDDLVDLLDSMIGIDDKLSPLDEYDHLNFFWRQRAYQQFPYQFGFERRSLVRQSMFFGDLPENHQFKKQFISLTGVSIQDFLDLSWALGNSLDTDAEFLLSYNLLDSFKKGYPKEVIDNFVKSLSRNISEIRSWLKENDDKGRCPHEYLEFTPFVNFPLIQVLDGLLVSEMHVLFRCIEHFIYDRLRERDVDAFMAKFGKIFERYVKKALDYAEVSYSPEKQIEKTFGSQGKQIDFIVNENGANIFIDAKGVELNYQGKMTHSALILNYSTKSSVLSAIRQAHDVIRKLKDSLDNSIPSCLNNYLLVVTYKDLYLLNGRRYYENVAKKAMDKIYEEYKDYPLIRPENMYFITIDQLECACAMIKNSDFSFSEMIETAKKADNEKETRKFTFSQHLNCMRVEVKTPEYINDRQEQIFNKLKNARY